VPEGFKGKFQVKIEANLGPFEWKADTSWLSVP
jgi:hypothetical protein